MIVILIILGIFTVTLWLIIFISANDFEVPVKTKLPFKRTLIIFPHPDDEVLTSGGLTRRLKKLGHHVTLVFLTKGEKGTPDAHLNDVLKKIRTAEAQRSAYFLGIDKLLVEDFGDGELENKQSELKKYIHQLIKAVEPNLVITHDLTGIYGHPDHITCSEVITEEVVKNFPEITLWYHSLPRKVFSKLKLPVHMAKDPAFASKRALPTHRVFVGLETYQRVQALLSHKSQLESFKKSFPIKQLPLSFYISAMIFEYFHEVKR